MKRKIISILAVVLLMTAFFIGCNKDEDIQPGETSAAGQTAEAAGAKEDSQKPVATPQPPSGEVHVGLLYSDAGFEGELVKNNVRSLMAMSSIKISVTEMEADAENPAETINTMAGEGCEIIFTVGVDGKYAIEAAKENPGINFEIYGGHDTGGLHNVSGFYLRMYQQQYLNGQLAGSLSKTANIGYISENAENRDIRRVNAFALGVKAANPEAVVHFAWTGEEADVGYSDETPAALCDKGCDIIFSTETDEALINMAKENELLIIGPKNAGSDVIAMIEPSAFSYVFDKAKRTAQHNYKQNDIVEGWVGIEVYEIDFDKYPLLTGAQKTSMQDAVSEMANNTWDVFTGPITDKYGQTIIPEGVAIPDEDLLYMLWYVGNIEAMPPPMG